MAKYRYQCEKCDTILEMYASKEVEVVKHVECDGWAKRLFPNIGSKKVTETVDSFLGVRQEEDQKKQKPFENNQETCTEGDHGQPVYSVGLWPLH